MPCAKAALAALATLAGALAFASASAARPAAAGDDPTALLRASVAAPKTVSYVGQFETIRFSSSRAVATIVKIEHRAPALTRRWYVAPESLYGDYIITRGDATFEFDTKHARLTTSHNPTVDDQVAAASDISRVLRNYRAVLSGTQTVANRAAVAIDLINVYTGERSERVWIDRETHLVLRKEAYHANGAVASQAQFDELRYTDSIPDGIFSTDAPAGFAHVAGQDVEMMDSDIDRVIAQAGFKPVEPQNLPQGFALVSGDVRSVNGVRTLHLLYSDGLRSISLFENASGAAADFGTMRPKETSFEGHRAEYVEDGPTTLLTWRERNLAFALVGDLLTNELVAIAKSVVP
jgi:negative regulator of sigma E activity